MQAEYVEKRIKEEAEKKEIEERDNVRLLLTLTFLLAVFSEHLRSCLHSNEMYCKYLWL